MWLNAHVILGKLDNYRQAIWAGLCCNPGDFYGDINVHASAIVKWARASLKENIMIMNQIKTLAFAIKSVTIYMYLGEKELIVFLNRRLYVY